MVTMPSSSRSYIILDLHCSFFKIISIGICLAGVFPLNDLICMVNEFSYLRNNISFTIRENQKIRPIYINFLHGIFHTLLSSPRRGWGDGWSRMDVEDEGGRWEDDVERSKKIKNNYFEIINTIFLYIFGDTNRIIQTHTAVFMLTPSLAKRQYFRQNTPK